MPGKVKVNGAWKDVPEIYAKVNGAWKGVKEAYSKVNGTWQQWFALAGAVAAYFTAGQGSSTVYKINFETDSTSTLTSATTHDNHWGFANPGVAGYFAKAQSSTDVSKFVFSTDTSTVGAQTPVNMNRTTGMAQLDGVAGYGHRGDFNTTHTQFYKMTFSNESFSLAANTDTYVGDAGGGLQNAFSRAYIQETSVNNLLHRFFFSTETFDRIGAFAQSVGNGQAGINYSGVAGYIPYNKGNNEFFKISYPSETRSVMPNFSSSPYFNPSDASGRANPFVAGYIAEGESREMVKVAFPSETYSYFTPFSANVRRGGAFADAAMA